MKGRLLSMRRQRVAAELSHRPERPPLDERGVLELLRESLIAVCGSQKAAAIDLQLDSAQLSRKLSGVGAERFSLIELARSTPLLEDFAARLATAVGHEVRRRNSRERRERRKAELRRELIELMHEERIDRRRA